MLQSLFVPRQHQHHQYSTQVLQNAKCQYHDNFKEYPPSTETLTPELEWLSSYKREIGEATGSIKHDKFNCSNKLFPH